MNNNFYPFVNLPLEYSFNAMEPFIDEKTMELHHDKHLQTYIDNLNSILETTPQLQKLSLEQLIKYAGSFPPDIAPPIRNNAGGVYNHRFFFDMLANPTSKTPEGNISVLITQTFGTFENFISLMKKAALSVFGSGYAWLVHHNGQLKIITTANQNNPIEHNMCPLLAIDVWEHAYYLKHYNVRAAYIDDLLNVINWDIVNKNLMKCM